MIALAPSAPDTAPDIAPDIAPIDVALPAPAPELPTALVRAPIDDAGSADDFQIVWPDGSEQSLIGVAGDSPLLAAAPLAAELPPTVAPDLRAAVPFAAPRPETAVAPAATAASTELPAPAAADDLTDHAADHAGEIAVRGTPIVPLDEIEPPVAAPPPAPTPAPTPAPVADVPNLTFEMPKLAVTANHLPADHQPEEVVDAVRRALEAIEAASAAPARLPAVAVGDLPSFEPTRPLHFDVVDPLAAEPRRASDASFDPRPSPTGLAVAPVATTVTAPVAVEAPAVAVKPAISALEAALPVSSAASDAVSTAGGTDERVRALAESTSATTSGRGGFAAPTMNDSAEAVYARAAAQPTPIAGPAAGVASVVFVDEAPTEHEDRTGALSRLISSLRRK